MLRIIILLFILNFISVNSKGTIIYSNGTGGGDWGDSNAWNPMVVPDCGDTIFIGMGDVISIKDNHDYSEPGCNSPIFITIDTLGTIDFATNGKRLKLPCNSGFILNSGGNLIATGNGGGNSTFLEICGTTVWQKSDGPRTGPTVYGTPLPIKLLSFEANINENKVDLNWITATEINNDFFTIEKSKDGKIWQEVIETRGAGNSTQQISYFDSDYMPFVGQSYYRLKQTGFNGEFSYSNIVSVYYNSESIGSLTLFPNPIEVGGELSVSFNDIEEDEILVVLIDVTGKEYFSKLYLGIEKGQLIGVPIEKAIPAGIYLVTATSENRVYNKKLVVR